MLFDRVIQEIEKKKENKEKGIHNGITFPFQKWKEYISCYEKGMYYGVLGTSGIGKSRFTRYNIYKMVEFAQLNDYKCIILYFAMEDSEIRVYKKIIAHYLWERHRIDIDPKYLDSPDTPLPDKYLNIIKQDKEFFGRFEDIVKIINGRSTPNEIEKICKQAHEKYGETHHIVTIIDNYSNITQDAEDQSEWAAVKRLSRNIIRLDLCQKLNLTVIAILQTDADSDKNAYRNAGKGGATTIEPNNSSLGDIKVITRDFYVLFALFSPWKYDLEYYPSNNPEKAYNINVLRNRFRSVLMLKNNEGEEGPRLGLYFDGKHEIFKEMPDVQDKETLNQLYKNIEQEELNKKERFGKNSLFNP